MANSPNINDHHIMSRVLIFLTSLLFTATAMAQFGPTLGGDDSSSEIVVEATQVAPGDSFYVALDIQHPEHWHSYFSNPGSLGTPPAAKWTLPEGFTASDTIFPVPHVTKTGDGSAVLYGYEGQVTFLFKITAPADLAPGQDLTFTGNASWQICKVQCKFEEQEIAFTIKSGNETIRDPDQAGLFQEALSKLPAPTGDWTAEVTEDEKGFTFVATAPEGVEPEEPVYFFATDEQVDSQTNQEVTIDGRTITIKAPRNRGNKDVFISAAEVLDTLTGVLSYHTDEGEQGVILTAPLDSNSAVESAPEKENKAAFIPATDEERAAGAAVYDPEARPEFVLLGGTKEKSVTFLSSLGLVFIGGLLLNLMPCVFPVLGLKVMGFVAQAGEDESKIKKHGLIFGLGLLVTMWILALVIISLDLNWGQQLSNPIFLGSIILLLFVMGLNLFGLFEIGTSLTGVGGELQSKKGYSGSFFSGALTTLIATPCSGPFLGAVMGFALSQSKGVALAIFTVFALGIAAPYIILSFFPALIRKLPRPGAWMESFKQLMSFAIFATVAFFMKSYLKLVGIDSFTIYLFALVFIGLAAYIYGRWGTPTKKPKQRYVTGYGIAGAFAILGGVMAFNSAKLSDESTQTAAKVGDLSWNEWYPGRLELSRPKNRIVWIDYTAEW